MSDYFYNRRELELATKLSHFLFDVRRLDCGIVNVGIHLDFILFCRVGVRQFSRVGARHLYVWSRGGLSELVITLVSDERLNAGVKFTRQAVIIQ
jgi:hypothetical protein